MVDRHPRTRQRGQERLHHEVSEARESPQSPTAQCRDIGRPRAERADREALELFTLVGGQGAKPLECSDE